MTTIRTYRKQARARATASGTSHQAEMNAIARENGHVDWGSFQRHLKQTTDDVNDVSHLEALIDAYEATRRIGGHMVVLRTDPPHEMEAIDMLRGAADTRLTGIAFAETMNGRAMLEAEDRGETLVTGSGGMEKSMAEGNFIIMHADQDLSRMNSIMTKADREMLRTAAVAGDVPSPENAGQATGHDESGYGSTIRRSKAVRVIEPAIFPKLRGEDAGTDVDWNVSRGRLGMDAAEPAFIPGFNILGPDMLPEGDGDRLDHAERIASILIPDENDSRAGYFAEKGRSVMVGFLLVEMGRARNAARNASIPAMIDWIDDGQRSAWERDRLLATKARQESRFHDRSAMAEWLEDLSEEIRLKDYGARAFAELMSLVSMAPNERSGVMGIMDRGLIPFKGRVVRSRNL